MKLETYYSVAMQMADGCSDLPELDTLREQRITSTSTLEILAELAPPGPRQYQQYPRRFQCLGQTPKELNTCPWATTVLERNAATGQIRARGVTCKRWGCGPCAGVKTRDLAQWIKLAAPDRLLTLTNDTGLDDNPELAWLRTAPLVPELIRVLRKRFGTIEYLRVVELTKAYNWPHYHLMLRSVYIPQKIITNEWRRLSGSPITDIRKVHDFFNSVTYLTKYLTKLRRLEWTERHLSYSRKFFPVSIKPIYDKSEWALIRKSKLEPHAYLYHLHPEKTLTQTAPLTFELPYEPMAHEEPAEPVPVEKPKNQQNMGW